jgi:hypothetical protein
MRTIRLLSALAVAVIACILSPAKSASRIRAAWFLWLKPMTQAPFWLTYRRYRACRHCPVFYPPLRTCGSPLSKEFRGLGCYCSTEIKCGILNASCWGDDISTQFTFGWRSHNK